MSRLLEKALERVGTLPEDEQDAIASQILASIGDEEAWKTHFAETRDVIRRMAREALEKNAKGESLPLQRSALMQNRTTRNFWRLFHDLPPDAQREASALTASSRQISAPQPEVQETGRRGQHLFRPDRPRLPSLGRHERRPGDLVLDRQPLRIGSPRLTTPAKHPRGRANLMTTGQYPGLVPARPYHSAKHRGNQPTMRVLHRT